MFRWRIFLLLGFLLFLHKVEAKEKCVDVALVQQEGDEEACQDDTYESYVECMRKRSKRSVDCYEEADCEDCDCSSCEYGDCGECSSCCESYEPIASCRTRSCCHSTCNSSCRNSSCRKRCRSSCREKITENLRDPSSSNTNADVKHNITTVINLHNLINNTNIIDMPITINNTNLNNITLDSRGSSSGCCKIIGPRQCVPTPTYPFSKCFHMRKNHCGSICTNPIMHAEPHQICEQSDGQNRCEQMVSFIPQPKPSCAYTSVYPYVSCSINEQNCVGCYNHIFNGGTPPSQCTPNCYDHNHNVGPMQNAQMPNVPMATFNQMLGGYPTAMNGVEGMMGMAGMGSMGGYAPMDNDYQIMPASNHSRRNADPGIGELMKALQEEPKIDSDKIQHE